MTKFDPVPSISFRALLEPLRQPGESALDAMERVLLWEYMKAAGWRQDKAAELLGIHKSSLNRRLALYGARRNDSEVSCVS